MAHQANIQDSFLFQSLKEDRPLDILLTTGKLFRQVRIKRFDPYAIVFTAGKRDVLVYKHAIAVVSDVEGAAPRLNGRPPAERRLSGAPGRAATRWTQ